MGAELTLTSEQKGSYAIISTTGYINNTGGDKIADECYRLIDEGIANFILNLEGSKVVNSIGISILIEIIEKLNEVEGQLVFSNLDPSIEKTFTIMGLFQFAGKADTVEAAAGKFSE